MLANEPDKCFRIRFPILWKPFEVFKDRIQARGGKDRYRIVRVFVEIGVENAHVLEISFTVYVKKVPAQVVQLKHVKEIGRRSNTCFYIACILVKVGLSSRLDLRNDRKTVTRRGLWKDRSVLTLL